MTSYASARNMKRTHRQELLMAETVNGQAINKLAEEFIKLIDTHNHLVSEIMFLQKELMSIKNTILGKGILTELEIMHYRTQIEEMEKMKSQALLIDPNKPQEQKNEQ